MICSSFRTVVYPRSFFSRSASWTSRTVEGPRSHSTRRISSSDAVGFCGCSFDMRRSLIRRFSYCQRKSSYSWPSQFPLTTPTVPLGDTSTDSCFHHRARDFPSVPYACLCALHLGSSTSGRPFFGLPIITTLAFELAASFSVASIPFHSSSCALMPVATIFWKRSEEHTSEL